MIHLPKPQSRSWGKWLEALSDAQLAAVGSWLRAGHYRRLLSPQVCWYQLCGRFDEDERGREMAFFATQERFLGPSGADQVFRSTKDASEAVRSFSEENPQEAA